MFAEMTLAPEGKTEEPLSTIYSERGTAANDITDKIRHANATTQREKRVASQVDVALRPMLQATVSSTVQVGGRMSMCPSAYVYMCVWVRACVPVDVCVSC